MASRQKAQIKPALLIWARESVHIPQSDAAKRVGIPLDRLRAWEAGEDAPSIPQLRKLGNLYKRPIAVFFLSEPPTTFDAQREFRKLKGIRAGKESTALLLALRQASYQRQVAIDLQNLLAAEMSEFQFPELHPDIDPELAGAHIREWLGIPWQTQLHSWPSPHAALKGWKSALESLGILIFQTGNIPLDEMRGVCLPDTPFPVILLNSKDAPHGRIFSLLHEFIHILFHAAGHRTSRMEGQKSPEEQMLEVAANRITATTLLPETEFLNVLKSYPGATQGDDDQLRLLSQKVKTSPETVLRRLVTLGQARATIYRVKRTEWQHEHGSNPWYIRQQKEVRIPQKIKILSKDGASYTRMVLEAYDRRLISSSTASDYLDAKPKHFPDLRKELTASPVSRI